LRVLIACEYSGVVRDAFRNFGHDAYSCDLLPNDSEFHFQRDVSDIIDAGWELMVAFPPCTHLAVSGARWFKDKQEDQEKALSFIHFLMEAPIEKIAIENPVGIISSKIRKPDQIIQPYDFGDDASKRTCLWLKNLPKLKSTKYVSPRLVNGKPRWSNQTDSGQNKLPPSEDRGLIRSKTYQGVAEAMASQWS
jgi:hypothetical protein